MRRAKSSRIVDCGRRTEEYGRHRSTCETSVRRMIIQVRNTDKYQVLGTAVSGIGLHVLGVFDCSMKYEEFKLLRHIPNTSAWHYYPTVHDILSDSSGRSRIRPNFLDVIGPRPAVGQ